MDQHEADQPGCTCVRLVLAGGDRQTVGYDWRAGCPLHGTASRWYLEQGGQAYFAAYRAHVVEVQRIAREARRSGIPGTVPPPPRREDFIHGE